MEDFKKIIKGSGTKRLEETVSYLRVVKSDLSSGRQLSERNNKNYREISEMIKIVDEELINRMLKGDF